MASNEAARSAEDDGLVGIDIDLLDGLDLNSVSLARRQEACAGTCSNIHDQTFVIRDGGHFIAFCYLLVEAFFVLVLHLHYIRTFVPIFYSTLIMLNELTIQ